MQVKCFLKEIMDERELNQAQLAEATKLSPTTIRNYYRNKFSRIDTDSAYVLGQYFNVSFGDLFKFDFEV